MSDAPETTTEAGTKKSPKGWWVNPPEEIKKLIEQRCEESLRDPQQEIVWLLRDWYRKVHLPARGQTDKAPQEDPPIDTGI